MQRVVITTWTSLLISIGIIIGVGNVGTGDNVIFCSWVEMSSLYFILFGLFGVLSVGTLLLYLRLTHVMMKRSRVNRVSTNQASYLQRRRRERTKTMLLVVGSYYILYFPSFITELISFEQSTRRWLFRIQPI